MACYKMPVGLTRDGSGVEFGTAARILFPKFTRAPIYR